MKQFRNTDYYVSEEGKVFSNKYKTLRELKTGRSFKGNKENNNYYLNIAIQLNNKKQKSFLIHRMVAECYLENYSEELQVNHIDSNKQNNNVNNLEMVTNRQNYNHYMKQSGRNPYKFNIINEKRNINVNVYTLKEVIEILGYDNNSRNSLFYINCKKTIKEGFIIKKIYLDSYKND